MSLDAQVSGHQWPRAIAALASVSEYIQFSVARELTLSAVNSLRTTHAEVVLSPAFFETYLWDPRNCPAEGYERGTETYSFVVPSKHLAVLFKSKAIESVKILLHRFKVVFVVSTKNLIVKKYQVAYQPIKNDSDNAALYKQSLIEGPSQLFIMETKTMRSFLDLAPMPTEDFRIETKDEKITFSAYTEPVQREKDYLKQPMLVTILMPLDELVENKVSDVRLCFGLKDFRTFVALCGVNGTLQALFTEGGKPLAMLLNHSDMAIRFVFLTSKEATDFVLHGHTVAPTEEEFGPTQVPRPRSIFDSVY